MRLQLAVLALNGYRIFIFQFYIAHLIAVKDRGRIMGNDLESGRSEFRFSIDRAHASAAAYSVTSFNDQSRTQALNFAGGFRSSLYKQVRFRIFVFSPPFPAG